MKLSEFKNYLQKSDSLAFELENGLKIPAHFHVTEVGMTTKNFIDCGGMVREEKKVNFQLWYDKDTDHRLAVEKLMNIIALSEQKLNIQDLEIEVEYQADTVGKYNLEYKDGVFKLISTETDCLAKDKCGIPEPEVVQPTSCAPNSGCC